MQIFLLEYLFFVVGVFIIVTCFSAASLFFVTYRYERQLLQVWRAIGFCALAVSFLLLILERKFASFGLLAVVFQLFGFYSIFRGVKAEPSLKHLTK
ncbi:MAG: hypothetical protein ACOYUZ_06345 [Patescibacteria group bacterium]